MSPETNNQPGPLFPSPPTIGQSATWAIHLEASTPKPGNVHPMASFDDMTYGDMVQAALAIGPVFDQAADLSIGQLIRQSVQATRQACGRNTNLGTLLLFAPLSKVTRLPVESAELHTVLASLTQQDAHDVYEAIRLAAPGGLGTTSQGDVHDAPPSDLLQAMRWAADKDLVARQWSNDYTELLQHVVPYLRNDRRSGLSLIMAIIDTHVWTMSRYPDSLIARKLGSDMARQSASLAADVLASGPPDQVPYEDALLKFDAWLRADGHRRNPGTTADLIAAALFVLFRESAGMEKEFFLEIGRGYRMR